VPFFFILSRVLSSLWVSRTGSASDWCALQEVLYKCIDTIQYNTIQGDLGCLVCYHNLQTSKDTLKSQVHGTSLFMNIKCMFVCKYNNMTCLQNFLRPYFNKNNTLPQRSEAFLKSNLQERSAQCGVHLSSSLTCPQSY